MSGQVVIYGLADARDGRVRYVGKTTNPAQRLYMHLWYAQSGTTDTYRDRWIRRLLADGGALTMTILEEVTTGNWQERERHWIAALPDLTNTSAGGDGVDAPRTPEWRRNIGLSHRGLHHSEETRRRLREANPATHREACAKGHPYTPETTAYTKQGHRVCRICEREKHRRNRPQHNEYRRTRWYVHAEPRKTCKRGHPLEGENLRLMERSASDGRHSKIERICRECARERNRKAKATKRSQNRG